MLCIGSFGRRIRAYLPVNETAQSRFYIYVHVNSECVNKKCQNIYLSGLALPIAIVAKCEEIINLAQKI